MRPRRSGRARSRSTATGGYLRVETDDDLDPDVRRSRRFAAEGVTLHGVPGRGGRGRRPRRRPRRRSSLRPTTIEQVARFAARAARRCRRSRRSSSRSSPPACCSIPAVTDWLALCRRRRGREGRARGAAHARGARARRSARRGRRRDDRDRRGRRARDPRALPRCHDVRIVSEEVGIARRRRPRPWWSTRSTAREREARDPVFRLSSRSPTAPRSADVLFGYVYDFGAARSGPRARRAARD